MASAAANLHNNTPQAVAARRAYWATRRSSAAGSSSTARSPRSQRGAGGAALASRASGHVTSYARNPAKYTQHNAVGGAVLTFFALMAISSLRRGSWPDQHQLLTIAGGTIVVVVAASVAPELVTHVLLVVLLIMVLTNATIVLKLLGWATGRASGVAA